MHVECQVIGAFCDHFHIMFLGDFHAMYIEVKFYYFLQINNGTFRQEELHRLRC